MFQDFDIWEFFRKNRKQILLAIVSFWIIFALLIIIEDEIALKISGVKADPLDRLQYCIRWVLWTLLTPVIIFLAVQFPISRKHLLQGILKHFFFAIAIVGVEFAIEIPIVRYAALKITGTKPPVYDYAIVFILKVNIYFLLYFLAVGVTYLVLNIESTNRTRILATEAGIKNQQLQTQLAEAKLSMLKMQIDPHFLFNTHHSIVSLIMNNENDRAVSMLTKLSDLLRLSLEDHQQTILLEKEIHLIKLYLDIQKIRFQDRLNIAFCIEPKTLIQKVPSFILQPIVENAIKHGFSLSSDRVSINIKASLTDSQLVLSVENNGGTIDFKNFQAGIGIRNTRERLYHLYNGASKFELNNLQDKGVIALITLPIN